MLHKKLRCCQKNYYPKYKSYSFIINCTKIKIGSQREGFAVNGLVEWLAGRVGCLSK